MAARRSDPRCAVAGALARDARLCPWRALPRLALAPGGTIVGIVRGGAGHLGLAGASRSIRSLDGGAHLDTAGGHCGQRLGRPRLCLRRPPAGTLDRRLPPDSAATTRTATTPRALPGQPGASGRGARHAVARRGSDLGAARAARPSRRCAPATPTARSSRWPMVRWRCRFYGATAARICSARSTANCQRDAMCSYLLRSRDDGVTWGDPPVIAARANETGLIALPGGELLASLRGDAPDRNACRSRGRPTAAGPGRCRSAAHRRRPVSGRLRRAGERRSPPHLRQPQPALSRRGPDQPRRWAHLARPPADLLGRTLRLRRVDPRPTDLGYPSSVVRRTGTTGMA